MKNFSNSPGFLFDLDGVIIDSESQYTRIWSLINQEFPTGIENFENKIKGSTLSKILNENYADHSTRQKVAERLHELESKMHYSYLPGALELLEKLKSENLPAALVTSSDTKKMSHLYEELPEISQYFNVIITGDKITKSKPSPEGYLLGAAEIYRNPKNCVVFEDSLQGVMAGKAAGAFVAAVRGTVDDSQLEPYSQIIINNLGEIDLEELILILT